VERDWLGLRVGRLVVDDVGVDELLEKGDGESRTMSG